MQRGDSSGAYQQLPRGVRAASGLSRAQVIAHQRARLHRAMVEIAAERGYAQTTITAVCALAGVSRRTFYDLFGDDRCTPKEACFLEAYDRVVSAAAERIARAYRSERDPHRRLCRALEQFAHEAVDEPATTRIALVETLGAGPAALARMRRTRLVFERMIAVSFAGQTPDDALGRGAQTVMPLLAKAIACGIERVTRGLLLGGRIGELPGLAEGLADWALSYRPPASGDIGLDSLLHTHARTRVSRARGRPSGPGNDRVRLVCAAARLAAADGYAALTPARIAHAGGVEEAEFYELFADTEQCFLEALDRLALEALVHIVTASRGDPDPLVGVHRAMVALMDDLATNPVLIRVAFVEIFVVGETGIARRERLLGQFSRQLARSLSGRANVSELAVQASVGAIWGLVHEHVTRGATRELPGLTDLVTYIALAPVVGAQAAVASIRAGQPH